jgi:hypothetical protein
MASAVQYGECSEYGESSAVWRVQCSMASTGQYDVYEYVYILYRTCNSWSRCIRLSTWDPTDILLVGGIQRTVRASQTMYGSNSLSTDTVCTGYTWTVV